MLKRILQVIGTMNYGGAETYLMNIYRNIDREKIQFDFLVFGDEGAFDDEIKSLGGKIYYFAKRLYSNPVDYCKSIKNFFLEHKEYEIVHSHLNDMSGFVVRGAKKAGIKYTICHAHVANPQTDFLHRLAWNIGRRMIGKNTDYIFGCSQMAVDYLSEHFRGEKEVIKNAIDVDRFKFNSIACANIRKELGISENSLVLISVARFSPVKNHTFMVELFTEVKKVRNDCAMLFVGEGGLRAQLEQKIKEMNLTDIHFVGVQSNVEDWLSAADVFLFPSYYEGLGIAVVEAQVNGLVCAVSDTVPHEADLKTGQAVFMPLDDIERWKELVLSAKRFDDETTIKLAATEAGYDISDVSKKLTEFYLNKR